MIRKAIRQSFSKYNIKSSTETLQLKTPLLTLRKCSKRYRLLIMVTSNPENFERRLNIRSTWGSTWQNRMDLPGWKTVFQLGKLDNAEVRMKTRIEATKYKDMIFGDFPDTFYTLSIKVIMGFEWATKFCNFDFLLKTDDDVFVNIPKVFTFLSVPDIPKSKLYAGNGHFNDFPIRSRRKKSGMKYVVSIQEYPYRKYPSFCSGGAILLSRDVAAGMVDIHNNSNYFKLDDVYVGMLALRLGVNPYHEDMFNLDSTDCECNQANIVKHIGHYAQCMKELYNCEWYQSKKTFTDISVREGDGFQRESEEEVIDPFENMPG